MYIGKISSKLFSHQDHAISKWPQIYLKFLCILDSNLNFGILRTFWRTIEMWSNCKEGYSQQKPKFR